MTSFSSFCYLIPVLRLIGITMVDHFPAAALMSSIYDDHRDEDGFLYIAYSGENTFGGLQQLSA
eukprot:1143828-Pelagomonas_calceolata.AAC.2